MKKKFSSVFNGLPVASLAVVALMSSGAVADAVPPGPTRPQSKTGSKKPAGAAQSLRATSSNATTSTQILSESNTVSQVARMGLDIGLLNQVGGSDVRQILKVVQAQRSADGVESVRKTLAAISQAPTGGDFLKQLAEVVSLGGDPDKLRYLTRSIGVQGAQVSDAGKLLKSIKDLSSDPDAFRRAIVGISEVQSPDDLKALSDLALFIKKLSAEAAKSFNGLTFESQKTFFSLYGGNYSSEEYLEISSILLNSPLVEKLLLLSNERSKYGLDNQLLQEAARVGNLILQDVTYESSISLNSENAFTYDRLFKNNYNKALVALIAKYSNSDRLVEGVNVFVSGKTINNQTLLSSVFPEGSRNTDLLGLRGFHYADLTGGRLDYRIGQGEAVFGRNISLGGATPVMLDLTATNLAAVGASGGLNLWREETRLFAFSALANMNLSGNISLLNASQKSASGWSVVSLGAMGALTIADSTQISSQSRVLALGGGKVGGQGGAPINGLRISSRDSIAIGSGSDLSLVSTSFNILQGAPSNRALLYAEKTLSADGISFSGMRGQIFMEAITLNLSNVDFPDGLTVKLVSRDGGTANGMDGSGFYPFFGSGQTGRVNFGQGVRYNGALISSKDEFDFYGAGILIGKISQLPNLNASRDDFAGGLQHEHVFRGMTEAQQTRFFRLSTPATGSFVADNVLANSELMEKLPSVLDDAARYRLSNPLLQEAAAVGNSLIESWSYSGPLMLNSADAFSYEKVFPNGYNKALVLLIAKYSNNERLFQMINAFAESKNTTSPINSQTLLSTLFTEGGPNTDLLGLRKIDYFTPSTSNLNYTLGQGETFFQRDINLLGGGDAEAVVDVTGTKLSQAGDTKQSARLVASVAVGDANLSGNITIKNSNANAATTRNVIAIGALNSMKVADNTKIVNQGRILAVGAGKLRSGSGSDRIAGMELESNGAILVGSGKNMHLVDAKFKINANKADLILYAQDTMTLENPTFNFRGRSAIFMEATTVNLSGVNFPGGSKVTLVSRDGGTANGLSGNGKYPVFGSSVVGRVNFIRDVKYDSNPIGNTAAFDTHGGDITIRKAGASGKP